MLRQRWARVGTFATGLVLAAALAGCTSGGTASPPASPSPSSPSSSATTPQQTLRFSVYGGPVAIRAYREIADAFEADHPGVTIVLKRHSDAASAAEDAFADLSVQGSPSPGSSPSATGSPSGSPSESPTPSPTPRALTAPDVFLLDQHYLPDLVSTGRLHPLDEDLEERGVDFGDGFQRIALTAFSADSALQCMPFEMSPTVLFVNKRLVKYPRLDGQAITPPGEDGSWRWEDFAAAATLVGQQARPGVKATYLPDDTDLLSALLRTAGSDIVDDVDRPGQLTLDNDAGREVLTSYVQLARDRRVNLSARQELEVDAVTRFTRNRLAFLFGTRADVPALRASGVPFDALSVPGFGRSRTSSAISGLCVDSGSEVLETAVDFVAFAVSPDSLLTAARSGALVPASLDAVNSPEFEQSGRPPRTIAPFLEGQRRSVVMPYSLGWRLAESRIEQLVARLEASTAPDLEAELDRELPAIDEESKDWFTQGDDQE